MSGAQKIFDQGYRVRAENQLVRANFSPSRMKSANNEICILTGLNRSYATKKMAVDLIYNDYGPKFAKQGWEYAVLFQSSCKIQPSVSSID